MNTKIEFNDRGMSNSQKCIALIFIITPALVYFLLNLAGEAWIGIGIMRLLSPFALISIVYLLIDKVENTNVELQDVQPGQKKLVIHHYSPFKTKSFKETPGLKIESIFSETSKGKHVGSITINLIGKKISFYVLDCHKLATSIREFISKEDEIVLIEMKN